jgi:hypothetical protein
LHWWPARCCSFCRLTQEYVARLLEGFAGQDLATQMRFGEYKDALILIERYPIFGVGFTGTPDLDIYLGVSMLYLIMCRKTWGWWGWRSS